MVACICHSPLHHQKPDFEGQSVIKASSYFLPFVLEAHRESLPRSCETSARRLSAKSAEVYSTADLPASAAHIPFSMVTTRYSDQQGSKSRQKVMQLYKQWHRPISKRFIKPPYSISRAFVKKEKKNEKCAQLTINTNINTLIVPFQCT